MNIVKLNDKAELMLVISKRTKHLHNIPNFITIGNAQIPLKQCVKNLGLTLDCHLSLNEHVSNIAHISSDIYPLISDKYSNFLICICFCFVKSRLF